MGEAMIVYRNKGWLCRAVTGIAAALLVGLFALKGHAQDLFVANVTSSEVHFGVLAHGIDGVEGGADINAEFNLRSPIPDDVISGAPWWLKWTLQPRPTIGASVNTAGQTDQAYVGANWTWLLKDNIFNPGDGVFLGYFFGPGFNNGVLGPAPPDRQALGSHILFREAFDLGYQINPAWNVSVFFDHISNGGLAKYNQAINDAGVRIGFRF